MRLHNTLSHRLEDFAPIEPGRVRMYNCGPTVYGDQHVGNYRTFTFADTLRRWFEYKGWKVDQIVNITDVGHLTRDDIEAGEDKIVVEARKRGWTALQVAEHFMERFFKDRDTLGLLKPMKFTRATEHIPEMIDLIQKLFEKGLAYQVGGNVYFDVGKFPSYGRLSGNSLDQIKSGARVEVNPEKRHPADFALWKTDAKHLMQWDSPWGRGFPGWHIECSAMSMKYLGETFDLHTGGEDNIFPHHECEIAQSEGATGKPMARFWLHARHLMWDGKKISKSLGNVVLVQDLLDKGYTPAEIRYALVRTRYSQQVNFSWSLFDDSKSALRRLDEVRRRLEEAAGKPTAGKLDLDAARVSFEERMDDDLDVAGALGVLHTFAQEGSRALDQGLAGEPARAAFAQLGRFDAVIGVLGAAAPEAEAPEEVRKLAADRVDARKRRDFKGSDELRAKIQALGWSVEDTKDGFKLRKE